MDQRLLAVRTSSHEGEVMESSAMFPVSDLTRVKIDTVYVLDLFNFADTLNEGDVRRIMGLTARISTLATDSEEQGA